MECHPANEGTSKCIVGPPQQGLSHETTHKSRLEEDVWQRGEDRSWQVIAFSDSGAAMHGP